MDINCLLCFNSNITSVVNFRKDGQHGVSPLILDEEAQHIVKLHFKWFETICFSEKDPLRICCVCWKKVQSFHDFHQSVQEHYRNHQIDVKCEINRKEDIFGSDDNEEDLKHQHWSTPASPIAAIEAVDVRLIVKSESDDEDHIPINTLKTKSRKTIVLPRASKSNVKLPSAPKSTRQTPNVNEIGEYFDMNCDLCDCRFHTMKEARQHHRLQHNQAGYLVCCSRKFRTSVKVREHVDWHRNPTMFDCSLCSSKFQSKGALGKHCESQHTSPDERQYRCELCSKAFGKKHLLTFHHQMIHAVHADKKFECYICRRRYVYMSLLQNHLRTTHNSQPTHICDVCAKSFKSAHSYEHHYEVEHSQSTQRAQCEQCGKWLKHARSLIRHMESHDSVQQTCELCGHISPGKRALYVHIKTMHHAPRHKCFVCDRLFRKSSNLKEHMAIHQNIRDLYKCPWCPMSCRSSANMSKHRRRVHPVEHMADKANPFTKSEIA